MKNKGIVAMSLLAAILLATAGALADRDDEREEHEEHEERSRDERRRGMASSPVMPPPSMDPVYQKECGSCHLPFPVGMLPERSWRAMMGDLSHHFGEDATLPEGEVQQVLAYALANSGERTLDRHARRMANSVSPAVTPLRISETPYFIKEHREAAHLVTPGGRVSLWSDCRGCHSRAEAGSYSEREIRLPNGQRVE